TKVFSFPRQIPALQGNYNHGFFRCLHLIYKMSVFVSFNCQLGPA
ncbi:mCG145976, partial [Mus musculus]